MFRLVRARTARPSQSPITLEEDRLWVAFYRRATDPAIAAEVIDQLDTDAELKRSHPALYLRCKHTLRKYKAHLARARRIRSFLLKMVGRLQRGSPRTSRPPAPIADRQVLEGFLESTRGLPQPLAQSRPVTAALATASDAGEQAALRDAKAA